MATQAMIAYAISNGGYHRSQLHIASYPKHDGLILNQRHNSIEKALARQWAVCEVRPLLQSEPSLRLQHWELAVPQAINLLGIRSTHRDR